ncbi:Protein-lysine N-methyltransferase EEF2KMT [Frankliniella fusca]|uniref:Protein-lysine N-methyltransferase EEF2KMT n=1 Tax=Frankliniella fusca TaxID=407009 RepID=A0AAE1HMZ9_9NEOP|nr:Protein-lysine N-methyltransferase EEF2KMT [Frankliniella fusca]
MICNPVTMLNAMQKISQQFLSGFSVSKMDFSDVIHDLTNSTFGETNQDAILSLTINHPLVVQYPLKMEYQQSFLRKLIRELEATGAEISGNLYKRHVEILQNSNGEKVFRHFPLFDGSIITVRDSISIVSGGTTGLYVWQAAHVLINWCFNNKELLANSSILELGSGAGLCGIAVSLLCSPGHYMFSDCHPTVMSALIENIKINNGVEYPETKSDHNLPPLNDRIMWYGNLKDSRISIAHLPWEDIVDEHFAPSIAPNFVIASDVVYDPSLFEPLSKTLKEFVTCGSQVILACTERNSKTLQEFIRALESLHLTVMDDATPKPSIMPVSDDWVVKIFKVSSA